MSELLVALPAAVRVGVLVDPPVSLKVSVICKLGTTVLAAVRAFPQSAAGCGTSCSAGG